MQTAASGIRWSATFARESRGKSKEPERATRRLTVFREVCARIAHCP
jgi:hypothetical protein